MNFAALIGAVSVLFAFICTIPQLVKLRGLDTAAGISVAALANSTVSGIAWTAYAVQRHELWVGLSAVVGLPATIATLVIAWRRGASRSRMWMPVAWTVLLAAAAGASRWVGSAPLTALLGFSIALMIVPAAVTAWRSHDVSALAANAWVLLITDALIAGTYGVAAHVTANVLYAAVAIAGSVAILVRLALPAHVHVKIVPAVARELPCPVAEQRGCCALVAA